MLGFGDDLLSTFTGTPFVGVTNNIDYLRCGNLKSVISCCNYLIKENLNPIKNYLKNKKTLVLGVIVSFFLTFLFVVGLNKPMDPTSVEEIEQLMSQMESKQ